MIQAEQCRCRIGASAANAATHGQDFFQPDINAKRATGLLFEGASRSDDQITVVGDVGDFRLKAHLSIIPKRETELVAVIEKLKQRLQFVITVSAAPGDVQHQIQFGWGGQCQSWLRHAHRPSLRGCQSLMTSVTSRSCPCSFMRSGNQKPFCWV